MNQLALDLQPADPSYRLIPLTQGQFAKVDAEDFERLSKYKWRAYWNPRAKSFYAVRWSPRNHYERRLIYMSREILNAQSGVQVDHIFHDTLDNRKSQLRPCTQTENSRNHRTARRNKSGLKGVTSDGNRWRATIRVNGLQKHLGSFKTPEQAHEAYKNAALEMHGKFACFSAID